MYKYQNAAEQIRQYLTQRNLPKNAFLPTEAALAAHCRVNRLTVRRALAHLADRKIISPVIGKRRQLLRRLERPAATALIGCLGQAEADHADRFRSLVYLRLFEALALELQQSNLCLTKILVTGATDRLPDIVRSPLMRGLISFGQFPARYRSNLAELPVIEINKGYEYDQAARHEIAFDAQAAFSRALDYLVDRGHRRIVWTDNGRPGRFPFFDEGRAACERVLAQRRLPALLYCPIKFDPEPDARRILDQLQQLFQRAPDTDAFVVASSDFTPFLLAGLTALGIAVPERVSLLAVGGVDPDLGTRLLTGFRNDYPAMAAAIGEYTRAILAGQLTHVPKILLNQFTLYEGNTVISRTGKRGGNHNRRPR